MANAVYSLLDDAAATGSPVRWRGGAGVFSVYAGAFGGATVALQWSPDDGVTWLPADQGGDKYVTLTSAGAGGFELGDVLIRANVSGGSPSGLYARVFGMPV